MSALSLFCFSTLCAMKKLFTTIICTSLDLTVFPKERIKGTAVPWVLHAEGVYHGQKIVCFELPRKF